MAKRELGIKAGEIWAYQRGTTHPLIPVTVIDPRTHYYAPIVIEPRYAWGRRWRQSILRAKLPCRWDQVEEYVKLHPAKRLEIERGPLPEPAPDDSHKPEPLNHEEVHVRARLAGVDFERPLAYNIPAAARAVGYGASTIRNAIYSGQLHPRYANTKPVILHDDLWAWVDGLPNYPSAHEPVTLRGPSKRRRKDP